MREASGSGILPDPERGLAGAFPGVFWEGWSFVGGEEGGVGEGEEPGRTSLRTHVWMVSSRSSSSFSVPGRACNGKSTCMGHMYEYHAHD